MSEHLKSTWSFKVQAGWNCHLSHLISYSPFQRLRSKSKACLIRRRGWRTCPLLGPSQELLELLPVQQLESLEHFQVLDPPQLETSRNWRWPRGWHSRSMLRRTWGPRRRYLKQAWFLGFFISLPPIEQKTIKRICCFCAGCDAAGHQRHPAGWHHHDTVCVSQDYRRAAGRKDQRQAELYPRGEAGGGATGGWTGRDSHQIRGRAGDQRLPSGQQRSNVFCCKYILFQSSFRGTHSVVCFPLFFRLQGGRWRLKKPCRESANILRLPSPSEERISLQAKSPKRENARSTWLSKVCGYRKLIFQILAFRTCKLCPLSSCVHNPIVFI